jgi:hypothetical protein
MTGEKPDADAEFSAIQAAYAALAPLDEPARRRVLDYISARLGIATGMAPVGRKADGLGEVNEDDVLETRVPAGAPQYASFAELYDAAQPKTDSDKALVAGYWLQVCQGAESFDGFSANKDLKHLGHSVGNITVAVDRLKSQKPALALQLKKSGKTKQARKTYKITTAGVKSVEAMING